jgi:hypothetical protein
MSFSFKKEVSENDGVYAPIPNGTYTVIFDSLDEGVTQKGGIAWNAKMKIVSNNRTFFLNWNVENANEVAQRIAREQITQIANLLGVPSDLIDLESIKTNKLFVVNLEQRSVGDKVYYQTKGPWKLAVSNVPSSVVTDAANKVNAILGTAGATKKKSPWDK